MAVPVVTLRIPGWVRAGSVITSDLTGVRV